jgi:hypothetical protein
VSGEPSRRPNPISALAFALAAEIVERGGGAAGTRTSPATTAPAVSGQPSKPGSPAASAAPSPAAGAPGRVAPGCDFRVGEACFASDTEACSAAGCKPGGCIVLESYPAQVTCK